MANRWGIPNNVEKYVIDRDSSCVYCGVPFSENDSSHKTKPSWEHIVNDIRINGINNIALCCMSCNASKGGKLLKVWLESDYCIKKHITTESVAKVVREAISYLPKLDN